MAEIFIPLHPRRVEQFTLPTVTQWNRVEGRPRTAAFDRSLRAEVRDGLWLLSRQWQLGEFRGDDAGAPVHAQMRMDHTRLTRAKLGEDPPEPMTAPLPLETRVERLRAALVRGERRIGYDLRLLLGRQWLAMIDGIGSYADDYLSAYRLVAPDPADLDPDVQGLAHPASYAMLSALDGLVVDGGELYLHLLEPGAAASDDITLAQPGHGQLLDDAGVAFVDWFNRLISQPDKDHDGAWTPDRLEYQFAASAPSSATEAKVYRAAEHSGGDLDWWSMDVDPDRTSLDEQNPEPEDATVLGFEVRTVIPSPVQFDGMPNPRWWMFEDGRVNLGTVSAATTDLAKLLFLEFGLLYSNDWFVVPFTAPAATVLTITGCVVTNTFGEHFWVTPAAKGRDDDPRRFALFTSSVMGDARLPADTGLMLLPTAPAVLDGPAREEVLFVRDEVANMVWGVEQVVQLPDGSAQRGAEAAHETRSWFERKVYEAGAVPSPDPDPAAPIRYRVMTGVPEHWIPFIPAQEPDQRQVRLQRASLTRVIEGADPDDVTRVEPLTMVLRPGLDSDTYVPYFLHEEEVPREGIRVTSRFRRARWRDGRVVVWLGARKAVGRGEGNSGLSFDRMVDAPFDGS